MYQLHQGSQNISFVGISIYQGFSGRSREFSQFQGISRDFTWRYTQLQIYTQIFQVYQLKQGFQGISRDVYVFQFAQFCTP